MIGFRALVTAGLAVVTMLSLQGCIGVGDSWTRDQAAPSVATSPAAGRPTASAPAATSAAGATISRVESNVAAVGNPTCGGVAPSAIAVTAEITDGGTPVTAKAHYAMTGGSYTGEVSLTRDATLARYTATLPKLEKKHFTSAATNIFVTVTIQGSTGQQGFTSITVTPCGGSTRA
ncbi:hypothetical protein [Catellatospora vulcania]|uniref:hypothetical protein n=1 Tax=Catellatospora vulcania TaxID=1460450 RepID=UPI0012D4C166|nr:hypothetical protein [Catellatospora vulcania]